MKDLYQIIKRPIITEKSNRQKELSNQITFEVDRKANKIEIKQAIERLFNVKVIKVNTFRVKGKEKMVGGRRGRTRHWKKAIVTLRTGDHIEFFEGV
ncbi:MAG: 50S ribosomal protein L23 [Deltaproteobacteria bacterium]|nr:50S ribosomal protein L23 [Deltaproteobacteria bacterium]MDL1971768.1 50S ribosomal protein L23 [Deltaproteobacteria bacterium]